MIVTDLYQGQSANINCIIQDASGTPYAHASILELWAILTIKDSNGNESVYARWSKVAKDGYKLAVQNASAGKYELLIERSESKAFPKQGQVFIEITAKIDSSLFAEEYVNIDKILVYEMKPAKSIVI